MERRDEWLCGGIFPLGKRGWWKVSRLQKRSFSLAGHRTSVALEPEFWSALVNMAGQRSVTVSALVAEVDAGREQAHPLASALRVLALQSYASTHGP